MSAVIAPLQTDRRVARSGQGGGVVASAAPVTFTRTRIRSLIGMRFGKLAVVAEAKQRVRPSGQTARYWNCVCDCGEAREFCTGQLRSGHTTSCGCVRTDKTIQRNYRHGQSLTAEHISWKHLRQRCMNPKDKDYADYGGRGIKVCERWNSFEAFISDMGPKPSPQHSIDRINVNGDYEPENCRWATQVEQRHNRRDRVR